MLNEVDAVEDRAEDFNINTRTPATERSGETQQSSLLIPSNANDETQLDPASSHHAASSSDECPTVIEGSLNENCQFLSILHDSGFLPYPTLQSDELNTMTSPLLSEDSDPFYADWPYWDQNISDALK